MGADFFHDGRTGFVIDRADVRIGEFIDAVFKLGRLNPIKEALTGSREVFAIDVVGIRLPIQPAQFHPATGTLGDWPDARSLATETSG